VSLKGSIAKLLQALAASALTAVLTCAGAQTPSPGVTVPASPKISSVAIQQPRPFGYVLGDVLTQRVLLQSNGRNFDLAQLPAGERVGLWVARRSSTIAPDDSGRRWLVIDYQLVNAPQQLMTVNLPALTLKSKAGTEVLEVPEWPISVAPLTPRIAFAKGGLQDLRPDHPAPSLPTKALWRQLEIWSSAFAFTVVAWLTWWLVRYIRAASNQPFARALRELRRDDGDSPQAWLVLHRAFDSTAGRTLQISTLPALFQRAPYFEPQRAEIEQFYAESTRRFFDVETRVARSTAQRCVSLRALCTALRRIEKQHER
jgi:mxaA protein